MLTVMFCTLVKGWELSITLVKGLELGVIFLWNPGLVSMQTIVMNLVCCKSAVLMKPKVQQNQLLMLQAFNADGHYLPGLTLYTHI